WIFWILNFWIADFNWPKSKIRNPKAKTSSFHSNPPEPRGPNIPQSEGNEQDNIEQDDASPVFPRFEKPVIGAGGDVNRHAGDAAEQRADQDISCGDFGEAESIVAERERHHVDQAHRHHDKKAVVAHLFVERSEAGHFRLDLFVKPVRGQPAG